ncbi:MAG: hypothetical protein IKK42_04270 [Oscillospiraceae bacterium]|nr:hypothetical protein [Oscillospiraceae bacterium]
MKKLISIILLSAMLLTACGKDEASVETTVSETTTVTEAETEAVTTTAALTETTFEATSYDFSIYEDAPVLSGEPREIDWSIVFDDNCVVIGAEKYPAYIRVGELSSDIELEIMGVGEVNTVNPDYLNDYYGINYLGHNVGAIITSRKNDENPKDAYINVWMFGEECAVPKEKVGILGFSFAQSYDEVTGIYLPEEESDSLANYNGVTERDGELFSCSLFYSPYITMLDVTPYEVNPDMYNQYTAK